MTLDPYRYDTLKKTVIICPDRIVKNYGVNYDMELMKKVILTACVLSVIISIADTLKPGEKFVAQLKPIFSLIFIGGILAAVSKTAFDIELPEIGDSSYSMEYSRINEQVNETLEKQISERINDSTAELLKEGGISCEEIRSEINIKESGGIDIKRIGYRGKSFTKAKTLIENNFPDTEVVKIE